MKVDENDDKTLLRREMISKWFQNNLKIISEWSWDDLKMISKWS